MDANLFGYRVYRFVSVEHITGRLDSRQVTKSKHFGKPQSRYNTYMYGIKLALTSRESVAGRRDAMAHVGLVQCKFGNGLI